jgi:hypothetical protein
VAAGLGRFVPHWTARAPILVDKVASCQANVSAKLV